MSRLVWSPALVLVVFAGCDGGKALPSTTPTHELPPSPPSPVQPAPAPAPTPSASLTTPETPLNLVIGRLHLTKGAQPLVDGHLIATEDFERRFGADWRKLLEGRRVRVTGKKYVHVCAPQEQCMTDGEIPQVIDVRVIEVCATSELLPDALPRSVPCPPREAEIAACKAECDVESRACDEASRGNRGPGLRRCGCARVSCFQGCAESAEALFRCR